MPPLDQEFSEHRPLLFRFLAYGPAKTKKTWWACRAVEAGFNVILLDSDDGAHILNQIAEKYWPQIMHVNIVDTLEDPVACKFMTFFLRGKPFLWDENTKKLCIPSSRDKEHSYLYINAKKLDRNTVVIIDSWTSITKSLIWRWYQENGIDVTEGEQAKHKNWDVYRWAGEMASWMVKQQKALASHVITIGHSTIYEKFKTINVGGKPVQVVDLDRMQASSTSGPHAMTIAKDFSDILLFKVSGARFSIDVTAESNRDGGGRIIPPSNYTYEDLQIEQICKMAKIPTPKQPTPQEAIKYFAPGKSIIIDGVNLEEFKSTGGLISSFNSGNSSDTPTKPNKITLGGLLKKEPPKQPETSEVKK